MQPRSVEQRLTSLDEQMQEMRDLRERVTGLESQILQLRQGLTSEFSAIRGEANTGDSETRVFMRVLFEDVLVRIKALGEGHDPAR